jgi:hypothetical protein
MWKISVVKTLMVHQEGSVNAMWDVFMRVVLLTPSATLITYFRQLLGWS